MAIQFELYKTPRPKDEADKETYHRNCMQNPNGNFTDRGRRKICPRISKPLYGGAAPGRGKRPFGWYRLLSDKAEQPGTNHFAQTKGKPNQTQSQHQFQGGYQT